MDVNGATPKGNSTMGDDHKQPASHKSSNVGSSGLAKFTEGLVQSRPNGQSSLKLLKAERLADIDMDFVIISEEKALMKSKVVASDDAAVLRNLSFITNTIPDARIWQFEVKDILTNNDSVTVHTEAERLLVGLMLIKAKDFLAVSKPPERSSETLSSANHRIVFVAKSIGTTLVKECLMRSRVSDEATRSSIWQSCRGSIFVDPLDADVVLKLRKELPQGFFAELGAKWGLSKFVRGQELSMALDEVDAIESAYGLISHEAPPRFSISTAVSGGPQTNVTGWKDLSNTVLKPQLEVLAEIIKDGWSKASPNPPLNVPSSTRQGAKLLSLDGGGVRGITSLLILEAIMRKVWTIEHPQQEYSGEDLEVHKYFQLAAGTSTGGLAAVMLFRLRMSVQEAIKAYGDFAEATFQPLPFNWLRVLFNGARFASAPLETSTKEIVKRYVPGVNAAEVKLLDPGRSPEDGKMFMCATRTDLGEVAILRSYTASTIRVPENSDPEQGDAEGDPSETDDAKEMNEIYKKQNPHVKTATGFEDITIWQAARATSAAPFYFPEMKFKGVSFWDGGLLNNNPIDQLWDARSDASMPATCILSLGTGRPTKTVLSPWAFINRVKQTLGFLTDPEPKHKDFERMIRRMNTKRQDFKQIHYFRLNVSTGSESIDLSDYKKIKDLKDYTKKYLDLPEVQEMIMRCAWMLTKEHPQNPA